MKTLKLFAEKNNIILTEVRYKHQFGYCKRKGYDLCHLNGKIIASFEPTYLDNEKWYLRNVHEGYTGKRYLTRITEKALNQLNLNADSFIVNSSVYNTIK